jgi:hypothetical protein
MPEFTGRYRFRKLNKIKDDPGLNFSCGSGRYAEEVEALLVRQYTGVADYAPVLLVMEDISGGTPQPMGACAWRVRRSPVNQGTEPFEELYIHLIGLSRPYRKHWLKGDVRLGAALLGAALKQIESDWRGKPMPIVWAYVSTGNTKSHRIFRENGFAYYSPRGLGDAIQFRPRGLKAP